MVSILHAGVETERPAGDPGGGDPVGDVPGGVAEGEHRFRKKPEPGLRVGLGLGHSTLLLLIASTTVWMRVCVVFRSNR